MENNKNAVFLKYNIKDKTSIRYSEIDLLKIIMITA